MGYGPMSLHLRDVNMELGLVCLCICPAVQSQIGIKKREKKSLKFCETTRILVFHSNSVSLKMVGYTARMN